MTRSTIPSAIVSRLQAGAVLALVCSAAAAVGLLAGRAEAQEGLNITDLSQKRIHIDGVVRDWRGVRFQQLGEDDDASMSFALGYDDQGLYLAAVVEDDRLVRTRRGGTDEDAVIVTLVLPSPSGGWSGYDLWFFSGVAGRQPASAALGRTGSKPRGLRGVQVVEGPAETDSGYALEARVPWKLVPGGRAWRKAKACIRLRDVDRPGRRSVKKDVVWAGLNPRRAERLPLLQVDGVVRSDPFKAFLRAKGLSGMRPRFDLRGNVCGDRRKERVSLVGTYAVVTGNGHREGEGFSFLELPVQRAGDIRAARLRDLTGNGKRELLVRFKQRAEWGAQELWQVISFAGQKSAVLFTAQARVETPEGFAESKMGFGTRRRSNGKRGGRQPTFTLAANKVQGLDRSSFRRPTFSNVEPLIAPWDLVIERVYAWNGSRFEVVSEKPNPELEEAGAGGAAGGVNGAGRATGSGSVRRGMSFERVLAEFRRARGIAPGVKARFQRKVNLAEDGRKENLAVLDRWLLVAGPGFRGGSSLSYFSIPVQDPADILEVKTADFTGDGRQEVYYRIRQSVGDVERELICVHGLNGAGFRRLLAVEVSRRQGGSRLENKVRVARHGRGRVLEVRAGRARGWSERSYPFVSEKRDGIEPLLLPWQGRVARYGFDENGRPTGR